MKKATKKKATKTSFKPLCTIEVGDTVMFNFNLFSVQVITRFDDKPLFVCGPVTLDAPNVSDFIVLSLQEIDHVYKGELVGYDRNVWSYTA